MSRAVVLGATGEMGARVLRLLRAAAPDAEVLGASRHGGGDVVRADVSDADSLRSALAGTRVVVNAVGPYDWSPAPLLAACAVAGCDYVDLAESPAFLASVARAAEAADAAAAGVAVVAGASTVPGLIEVLATELASPQVARVEAWLSMGSANPVSAGLLAGLLAPLGRPRPDEGRWFERTRPMGVAGRTLRFGDYPHPWPEGLPLAGRRVSASFHVGFDRAWLTRALSAGGRVLALLPESRIPALARMTAPAAGLLAGLGTPRGALAVLVRDADGSELARTEVMAERDGLDIPALPAVWAAAVSLAGTSRPAGVVPLADLVSASEARTRLAELGYEVRGSVLAESTGR